MKYLNRDYRSFREEVDLFWPSNHYQEMIDSPFVDSYVNADH